nr:phage tail fiber protein [uncultured Gellertiella sp.]
MASYTRVVFTGSTDTIYLTFDYLSKEHVQVKVGGAVVPSSAYTWLSSSQIKLSGGSPSAGTIGEARRVTPKGALVTYSPGNLDAGDLNISTLQPLYVSEERADLQEDLEFSVWLSAGQHPGGTILVGTSGQMLLFDASGNIVPGPTADQIASAQAYAEAAATFNPANFYTRAQADARFYTKDYLDGAFYTRSAVDTALSDKASLGALTSGLSGKVSKSGDTMTGYLVLAGGVAVGAATPSTNPQLQLRRSNGVQAGDVTFSIAGDALYIQAYNTSGALVNYLSASSVTAGLCTLNGSQIITAANIGTYAPAPTVSQVQNAMTALYPLNLGAYAFLTYTGTTALPAGNSVAGSSLTYGPGGTSVISGTWRCMGEIASGAGSARSSLFLRIA